VSAISADDLQSINNGTALYDPDASACGTSLTTGSLPSIIPEPYNSDFTNAGNANNVSPDLIAAFFTVEHFTHDQTSQLATAWVSLVQTQTDPNSGWKTSPTGAMGPFQFEPGTWAKYGDGVPSDVENLADASNAAAKYIAASGATTNTPVSSWQTFILDYGGFSLEPSQGTWYVDAVNEYYNYYSTGATNNSVSADPTGAAPATTCTSSVSCNNASTTTSDLSPTRQNIVCIAVQQYALWQSGQLKPGSGYIQYISGGIPEEWCADFASWVYKQAGIPLRSSDNGDVGAVKDIKNIGGGGSTPATPPFQWHPAGSYTPQPGDLVIHNTDVDGQYIADGHVNIVVAVSGTKLTMIGGDQADSKASSSYNQTIVSEYSINSFTYDTYNNASIDGYVSPD
jgi:hypothetical protein